MWLLLAVLFLGAAGCGDAGGGEESRVSSDPGEVRCGRPFRLPEPGALRLVARFPESAGAGEQTVSGTVEVTSREALRGVAAAAADAFLVRDGRVVTTPLPQDAVGVRWELAAGETRTMPAVTSLRPCEPQGGLLAPGDYELYVRVVVTPEEAFGGPSRLRLR